MKSLRELVAAVLWTVASWFDWVEWCISNTADRIAPNIGEES